MDGEGALVEGLGLGVVVLLLVEGGEFGEAVGDGGVVETVGFFADGEGALVEDPGLGGVVLLLVEGGEAVEAEGDAGVLGAEMLFPNDEGAWLCGDDARAGVFCRDSLFLVFGSFGNATGENFAGRGLRGEPGALSHGA